MWSRRRSTKPSRLRPQPTPRTGHVKPNVTDGKLRRLVRAPHGCPPKARDCGGRPTEHRAAGKPAPEGGTGSTVAMLVRRTNLPSSWTQASEPTAERIRSAILAGCDTTIECE